MNTGDTLGHYRIIEPIGQGGMGEVYLAEDTKLQRRVALKTLPAAFASDPERRSRFEREAQAIAALNHPGIVTIHSVEVDGPTPFLTMEYVEGRPLKGAIPAGGVPVDTLMKTAIGIADAVAAAHQRGIVHRDLKPANVMVCPDGRVKVLDFGLAKVHDAALSAMGDAPTRQLKDDLTGEGKIVGTIAYMSPEQAEGKPVDQRSDIFSLGVMLHEMATGERPFKGDTDISIISAIIKDTPSSVSDVRPDLPATLARIVKRCLVKDPQRRYQSARDLQNDLEDLKQDIDSGVVSSPSGAAASAAAPRGSRIPRAAIYGTAAVIVAGAAIGGWWFFGGRGSPPLEFAADRITRLTDNGTATVAALSPDGRYVVHIKSEQQQTGLWVRQTGTNSDVRVVPPGDAAIDGVSFSPDGTFVYYNAYPRGSGVATLFRVPVLGGTPVRVLEDVDGPVSFSPGGARFSFARGRQAENKTLLMSANADGTDVRAIATTSGENRAAPDVVPWSPDGRTILAMGSTTRNGLTKPQIIAIDVESGKIAPLGGEWTFITGLAWMPDGKSVIVSGVDDDVLQYSQLWQVSWPAGERRRITTGVNGHNKVTISADGRTLATIEGEARSSIWVYPMTGAPGRQLTSAARGNPGVGGLAWTRSGRFVYGASPGDAPNQLWTMDADGGNVAQLTNMRNEAAQPAVSADDAWVYFNGGENLARIWRMPLAGGEPVPLTKGPADVRPLVSPDGKWVYYTTINDGRTQSMKIPADGGEPVPVTPPELRFNALLISSDGALLFGGAWDAERRRPRAANVSTADGRVTFIENVLPFSAFPMPDGRSVLISDVRNGVSGLFLRTLAGGPDRLVADLGKDQAWRCVMSPDGKSIAIVRGRATNDVVLIKAR